MADQDADSTYDTERARFFSILDGATGRGVAEELREFLSEELSASRSDDIARRAEAQRMRLRLTIERSRSKNASAL